MSVKTKSIIPTTARILLGLIYAIFGLNYFLHFIPMPPLQSGATADFFNGLFQSGYFFPMLKGMEVVFGILLLIGLFVPLSLVIVVPISINILLFHAFLAPDGIALSIFIVVLNGYLLWAYRDHFKSFLKSKASLTA